MTDHGLFEAYRPRADNPILLAVPRALFARRVDTQEDWYEFQASLLPHTLKLLVRDGEIACATYDASMLPHPAGYQLFEVEHQTDDPGMLLRMGFVGGEIVEL